MSKANEASGWQEYLMDYHEPHKEPESIDKEIAVAASVLEVLQERGGPPPHPITRTCWTGDRWVRHLSKHSSLRIISEIQQPWGHASKAAEPKRLTVKGWAVSTIRFTRSSIIWGSDRKHNPFGFRFL